MPISETGPVEHAATERNREIPLETDPVIPNHAGLGKKASGWGWHSQARS